MLTHLARGRWLTRVDVPRFAVPELIAAPCPAYVSLQSALYHHGLIDHVPAVIYAVTLARPRRVRTLLGVVSFHRIPPALFAGFDVDRRGAKIATAEKALFDVLYLAPTRTRLFASLPEIELPRGFEWERLREWVSAVGSASRRTFLAKALTELNARTRK